MEVCDHSSSQSLVVRSSRRLAVRLAHDSRAAHVERRRLSKKALQSAAVVVVAVMAAIPPAPPRARVGQKIDNWLNHNLPFLEVQTEFMISGPDRVSRPEMLDPTCSCPSEVWRTAGGSFSLGYEFYDQMDAEEKAKVDSITPFKDVGAFLGASFIGQAAGGTAAAFATAITEGLAAPAAVGFVTGAFAHHFGGQAGGSIGSW